MRENLTQSFEIILKIDKNNAFLWFFQRNLWKLYQKFQNNWNFFRKPENLTQVFEFFWKIA